MTNDEIVKRLNICIDQLAQMTAEFMTAGPILAELCNRAASGRQFDEHNLRRIAVIIEGTEKMLTTVNTIRAEYAAKEAEKH